MTQNLTLVTQKPFGSLTCNFYKDDAIENEFYMTRRQIGEALGYVKADDAIQQIHDRNKDRLDPLSTTLTLGGIEGNRWVNRNTRVYTLRGVMEICRFSRQPNADKFMDFVWDVMESLYHGRSVLATPDQTSAVAMQTIQALVDSTLKTQAETTRCMVTMTSTLGVQRELGLIKDEPCIIKSPATSVLDEQPVPAPLPDESAKQPKPAPSQSLLDERAAAINAAIAKAAAIYYDTSCNFSVTYRNVYKIMNTDWNEAHIQFRNRYNRTAQQLKTLVMYSGVLFDRFNAAVNTYINAASKPEVESASKKEA